KSGQFAFPPIMDVRIDQAKAEIVIDRDKVSSMGLSMQQVGADLASMLGGNFVNRFNIDGRSYKVIAQIERAGRLTPEQLGDVHITGPPGMHFHLTEGWTTTLNIYSQVGLVTLVGLVAKNGILIVEFANTQQEAGMSKIDAVLAAASTRLRPILMTTVATVAGHFPL